MPEAMTRPVLAAEATAEDKRTLKVALAYWQSKLVTMPELLATSDGLAEWERVGQLLEALH